MTPRHCPHRSRVSQGAGVRSSPWPGVRAQACHAPLSLTTRCSLKPKHPPHGVLAVRGDPRADPMQGNTAVVADGPRRRDDEPEACTAPLIAGRVGVPRHPHPRPQGIARHSRKLGGQMGPDREGGIARAVPIATLMTVNQDRHDVNRRKTVGAPPGLGTNMWLPVPLRLARRAGHIWGLIRLSKDTLLACLRCPFYL